LGQIILATNYNVNQPVFTDDVEMLATEYAEMKKPSQSFTHHVDCSPEGTPLKLYFTRQDPQQGGDNRLSDFAIFQFASVGMQAVAVVGAVWVNYDFILVKPYLNYSLSAGNIDYFAISAPLNGTNILYNLYNPITTFYNDIGGLLTLFGGSVEYTFPRSLNTEDNYLLSVEVVQTYANTATSLPTNTVPFDVNYTQCRAISTLIGTTQLQSTTVPTNWCGLTQAQMTKPVMGQGNTTTLGRWETQVTVPNTGLTAGLTWSGGTFATGVTETSGSYLNLVRVIQLSGYYNPSST
jgi:hypothetical protein